RGRAVRSRRRIPTLVDTCRPGIRVPLGTPARRRRSPRTADRRPVARADTHRRVVVVAGETDRVAADRTVPPQGASVRPAERRIAGRGTRVCGVAATGPRRVPPLTCAASGIAALRGGRDAA